MPSRLGLELAQADVNEPHAADALDVHNAINQRFAYAGAALSGACSAGALLVVPASLSLIKATSSRTHLSGKTKLAAVRCSISTFYSHLRHHYGLQV